jgi:hypothetical protein
VDLLLALLGDEERPLRRRQLFADPLLPPVRDRHRAQDVCLPVVQRLDGERDAGRTGPPPQRPHPDGRHREREDPPMAPLALNWRTTGWPV